MKRIVPQAAALAALAAALGSSGCMNSSRAPLQSRYTEAVDPCTPERYNYQARQAALAPFAAHVTNGQVLDQFLQNGDFEEGKDVLTRGGQVKLDHLTRKRPVNGHIYLQTARDLPYDAAKPGDYAKAATDLNAKRTEVTMAYLNATTAGRNLAFDVAVIDPAEQLMPAAGPANAVRGFPSQFQSGINGITNVPVGGVGGSLSTAALGSTSALGSNAAGGGGAVPAGGVPAGGGGSGAIPSGK
jgi:hypothetical protein